MLFSPVYFIFILQILLFCLCYLQLLFRHGHKNLLRCDRQFSVPYTCRPVYGMCNSRCRSIDNYFSYRFGSKRSCRLIAVFKFHSQMPHIKTGWYLVLHKTRLYRASLRIVGDVLKQSVSYSLDYASLCLNTCQCRVYGYATIHDCRPDPDS